MITIDHKQSTANVHSFYLSHSSHVWTYLYEYYVVLCNNKNVQMHQHISLEMSVGTDCRHQNKLQGPAREAYWLPASPFQGFL